MAVHTTWHADSMRAITAPAASDRPVPCHTATRSCLCHRGPHHSVGRLTAFLSSEAYPPPFPHPFATTCRTCNPLHVTGTAGGIGSILEVVLEGPAEHTELGPRHNACLKAMHAYNTLHVHITTWIYFGIINCVVGVHLSEGMHCVHACNTMHASSAMHACGTGAMIRVQARRT